MASYLAEKYAYILTKEDILQLFKTLEGVYGSISRAARETGIQRKTAYDWPETGDVKLTTKIKILESSIKTKPDYTLNFLLERSEERASEILYVILTRLFERAMNEKLDPKNFVAVAKKLERMRKRHAGLVFEHLEEEVEDMSRLIRQRSYDLNVSLPPVAIETMKSTQVLEILPTIARSLPEVQTPAGYLEIARARNVPLELVTVSSTMLQIARAYYSKEQERETAAVSAGLPRIAPEEGIFKTPIPSRETADGLYNLWEGKS